MRSIFFQICLWIMAWCSHRAFSQSFVCGDTLVDPRDGKKYPTVLIGSQCWMKKNLNYGTMVNSVNTGTPHTDMANNSIPEKYCYGNVPYNCDLYGALYEWDELMGYTSTEGGQGLCPPGWHIPSILEYSILCNYSSLGANALKAIGQGFAGGLGTNTTGFSAILAGDRGSPGVFNGAGNVGLLWSSTPVGTERARNIYLRGQYDSITYMSPQRYTAFSCRCVKDVSNELAVHERLAATIVYPNPASDRVHINGIPSESGARIEIFDQLGILRLRDLEPETDQGIDTRELPDGLYFLRVTWKGVVREWKISITRP